MTKYKVFIQDELATADEIVKVWREIGVHEGHTPKAAVTAAIVASDNPAKMAAETFGTTPAGSFQVLSPKKVDVKTRVSFA